jgi:UTP--glucose-1-phosphate uridylyltransferase
MRKKVSALFSGAHMALHAVVAGALITIWVQLTMPSHFATLVRPCTTKKGLEAVDIKKAIITAAGKTQRSLPLQTLVDRDGATKTALRILIEEILAAGIEEICVVVCPGDQTAYAAAAGGRNGRLHFVEQASALGYGHAVSCAREFAATEPFLLLVGDHLYVSGSGKRAAQQLVEIARVENCAVSAVQATHESKLPYYGAVGGRLVAGRKGLYEVSEVIEKATPTEAEQRLIVPGLRAGHYLCFFGMHVLTPAVMEMLAAEVGRADSRNVPLSTSLASLAKRERYLASELAGRRYDIGVKYGLLTAQIALALDGQDRDEVLSGLVDLLARRTAH